jgi:predicted metal-dependent phosphoesterase TrpH
VRPEEAWREGLDAIAITDHIEYQPHKDDIPTNHERSFEIAKPNGDLLDVMVIRGSEITRDMPPGHLNAIFLEAVNPIDQTEWIDAARAASEQDAFIFWNHPGWTGQQKDGIARWYPEHDKLFEEKMLHGIEVVNSREYYPEAHQWCLDKKLTMLSNSDIHAPLNLDYAVWNGDHRPITLVFAKERSLEAIRDALFSQRTAVYSGNLLVGEETYLRPIFDASVRMVKTAITLKGDRGAYLQIKNWSDISYRLVQGNTVGGVSVPPSLELAAGKTVLVNIRSLSKNRSDTQKIKINYVVENLKITPDQGMPVDFEVEVTFLPEE